MRDTSSISENIIDRQDRVFRIAEKRGLTLIDHSEDADLTEDLRAFAADAQAMVIGG